MAYLGIELGSTRIKAALIDERHTVIATGAHDWENKLEGGFWTYGLDDAFKGVQDAFAKLRAAAPDVSVDAIGISAMMHGYLAFDKNDNLLAPFRTWRNTTTEESAYALSEAFGFNIPQRWSVAHLYQAILNGEPHVGNISFITTLAGYIHWQLTGKTVLGVGDASGMFPIGGIGYDERMLGIFGGIIKDKPYSWQLKDILPSVLVAGQNAGCLTEKGAKLLDPSGKLSAGIPFSPPEGDAGTGMCATNAVAARTGNVSAGTSVFAMIVLEKPLEEAHIEIDIVTTPTGLPVAMAHCNSCTSDIDAWVKLFEDVIRSQGIEPDRSKLYGAFYKAALEAEPDAGGLISFNYYSGEPITGLSSGVPLFMRPPDSNMSLANFARAKLFASIATLKIGMDILADEGVKLDVLMGHGGLFKAPIVGQRIMAAALGAPVAVMSSAGEGGAWGSALLAAYMHNKKDETLEAYLEKVFSQIKSMTVNPDPADASGFAVFIERYKKALSVEKAAAELRS